MGKLGQPCLLLGADVLWMSEGPSRLTSIRKTSRERASATISRTSAAFTPMGFSQRTALPAARQRSTADLCWGCWVAMYEISSVEGRREGQRIAHEKGLSASPQGQSGISVLILSVRRDYQALGRRRQEDSHFETSLDYIVRSVSKIQWARHGSLGL